MKADKKRKEKKKIQSLYTRRGIILIVILAVMILLVNVITASFSWFAPKDPVTNVGMKYERITNNRSERCDFSTYQGTIVESYSTGNYIGQINYDTQVTHVTIGPGDTEYFRTSIINSDPLYPSDISLYFASLGHTHDQSNPSDAATTNLTVAVSFPSNTVRIESGEKTDYCLARNAYVKPHDTTDVDGPGLLQIDWFIKNNGSESVTINLDEERNGGDYANMYLMYN